MRFSKRSIITFIVFLAVFFSLLSWLIRATTGEKRKKQDQWSPDSTDAGITVGIVFGSMLIGLILWSVWGDRTKPAVGQTAASKDAPDIAAATGISSDPAAAGKSPETTLGTGELGGVLGQGSEQAPGTSSSSPETAERVQGSAGSAGLVSDLPTSPVGATTNLTS